MIVLKNADLTNHGERHSTRHILNNKLPNSRSEMLMEGVPAKVNMYQAYTAIDLKFNGE